VRFKGYEEAIRKISATSRRQAAHDSMQEISIRGSLWFQVDILPGGEHIRVTWLPKEPENDWNCCRARWTC